MALCLFLSLHFGGAGALHHWLSPDAGMPGTRGHLAIVQALLDQRASPNLAERHGATPLCPRDKSHDKDNDFGSDLGYLWIPMDI